jgi:DNA-binding CsgD family transcriptional regulator
MLAPDMCATLGHLRSLTLESILLESTNALLDLYRAARELDCEDFQAKSMKLVQRQVDYDAGMWGMGRLNSDCSSVIPATVHTVNLDPRFSVEWSQRNHTDPVIRSLPMHVGRAMKVDVSKTYADVPDSIEAGRKYGIRSFAVIIVPGLRVREVQWLCLYQPRASLNASDEQLRWITFFAPHMAEAFRVNRLLHAEPVSNVLLQDDSGLAVADAASGLLIRADAGFQKFISELWRSFDGRNFPKNLDIQIRTRSAFIFIERGIQIIGCKTGLLVHLVARRVEAGAGLTSRQFEIAKMYASGLTCKTIARTLHVSHSTVRNHLAIVYESLKIHDKCSLASRVHELENEYSLRR